MLLPQDFVDLLDALNANKTDLLLVALCYVQEERILLLVVQSTNKTVVARCAKTQARGFC